MTRGGELPLSQLIGITQPAPGDWSIPALGWIFSIAIVFLGLAAAFCGKWVEEAGARKAMVTAAVLFGGGLIIGSIGVQLHQLWLLYAGYGVIGGCGLGIGYISPVKTLITWFPDRPGLAGEKQPGRVGERAPRPGPVQLAERSLQTVPQREPGLGHRHRRRGHRLVQGGQQVHQVSPRPGRKRLTEFSGHTEEVRVHRDRISGINWC